ncbi:MAG: RNA polymerase sigma factor [bacterium]
MVSEDEQGERNKPKENPGFPQALEDFWGSDLLESILGKWIENDCDDLGRVEYRIVQKLCEMERGFEIIYEKALNLVLPLIRAKIPYQDFEDVWLTFTLLLLKKVKTYRGDGRFKDWLRRLARSEIARYYREKGNEETIDLAEITEKVEDESDLDAEDLEMEFLYEEIKVAMEELPEEKRKLIELHYLKELKCSEIANMLGKPSGTIRRKLSEAMKELREILRRKASKICPESIFI